MSSNIKISNFRSYVFKSIGHLKHWKHIKIFSDGDLFSSTKFNLCLNVIDQCRSTISLGLVLSWTNLIEVFTSKISILLAVLASPSVQALCNFRFLALFVIRLASLSKSLQCLYALYNFPFAWLFASDGI